MTKDGIRDKVGRDLRALWGGVAREPAPQDMLGLLAKLK